MVEKGTEVKSSDEGVTTYIGDVKKSFRVPRGKDVNVEDVDVGDVLDSLSQ